MIEKIDGLEIIEVADGKYKVLRDDKTGSFWAYRHGELWRNLVGDNLILALFSEILKLRQQLEDARMS